MTHHPAELLHERSVPAMDVRELRVRRGGKWILPGISVQVPPAG